jgi:hypothetical protein
MPRSCRSASSASDVLSDHSTAPLLPVTVPPPQETPSHRRRRRRRRIIPVLLALPASLFSAAFAARAGVPRRGVAAAAIAAGSAVALCCAWREGRRRQREEDAEAAYTASGLMAWGEALGAVRKIVDTFSDGLAAPFTLKHMLLDAEIMRRHHTAVYDENRLKTWPASNLQVLVGTFNEVTCLCPNIDTSAQIRLT